MPTHAALRLAVRPRRGAAVLDQLAATATRGAAQIPESRQRPSICLRCSIAVAFRAAPAAPGRARFFSTAPPPPRQPPPPPFPSILSSQPNPDETKSHATPATPATAPTLPPILSEQLPKQPDPAPPSPLLASSPSSSSSTSSSEQPPRSDPPESSQPPPPTPPPADAEDPSLPSFTETHRHPLSARFSTMMDNLQSRVLTATQTLNDLTGYSAIEAIKARNSQLETDHGAAQRRLRNARQNYKSLNAHRAATQREVTTLLARQATWTPPDLERFTSLYRLDHELETQVGAASAELTDAETDESRLGTELNAGILKRYHEEQIWSDRIRRQSTWGTWGLMGVNVLMFLVLQFVAEPWRRKRLMRGIAENERGVMDDVRRELEEVRTALEKSGLREVATAEAAAVEAATASSSPSSIHPTAETTHAPVPPPHADLAPPPPTEPAERWDVPGKPWRDVLVDYWEDPELLREAVLDLTSERRIDLRMRDASVIALQGAAAGATVALVLAISLFRSSLF